MTVSSPDRLTEHLTRAYPIEIVPDVDTEGGLVYVALHPDLPGCMSHGATPEEALEGLREARELYIRSVIADGLEVPPPRARQPFAA